MSRWHAELAWLGGDEPVGRVLLETDGDRFVAVVPGVDRPADATALPGLTLPGLVDAHAHAFHRVLRARVGADAGDFWAWRDRMYAVADRLDPDGYHALARAVYAEKALAGVSTVGEFHYLHHGPGGTPYADPNAMAAALVAGATDAGIRLTLLDACYLQGDVDGRPLTGTQLRFGDGDADRWAARVAALPVGPRLRVGAAVHSVRAVPPAAMAEIARWARGRDLPLHLHASEQPAENVACRAATGRSPVMLCADTGVLGPTTTVVHAIHLDGADVAELAATRSAVCACPTTERELADGVVPAGRLVAAGVVLCLGSDSQAVVDPFEEARALDLDERLVTLRREAPTPAALLTAATATGAARLGWPDAGRLTPGALADFVTIDLDSPRTAGTDRRSVLRAAVYAASAADVRSVVIGGVPVVVDGRHVRLGPVGRLLGAAIRSVLAC